MITTTKRDILFTY